LNGEAAQEIQNRIQTKKTSADEEVVHIKKYNKSKQSQMTACVL
jgi:hypothetical protein